MQHFQNNVANNVFFLFDGAYLSCRKNVMRGVI